MGLLELVIIAVVALVLLGPQKLPEVLQQMGRLYVQLRRTSMEFRSAIDHVVRQAEEEARIEEIKRLTKLANEQTESLNTAVSQEVHSGPRPPLIQSEPQTRSDHATQVFDDPKPILSDAPITAALPAESEKTPSKILENSKSHSP